VVVEGRRTGFVKVFDSAIKKRGGIMEKRDRERLAKYFSVLQNELGLRILWFLKDGPAYVFQIVKKLKVKAAIVSRTLKSLRLINLVGFEQEDNRRKYYLKRKDIFELIMMFNEAIKRKNKQ